jgi:ADP-ribose pyrophosphatase
VSSEHHQRSAEPELLLTTSRFNVVRKQRVDAAGRPYTREVVQHPGAVVLLPVLDDGRICLIRNYRIAVEEELIELPAGTLEPGEPPAVTAERELAEETGYRASQWHEVMQFWMSPGILSERMHLFVARGLTPGERFLQDGEEINTLLATWDEVLELMATKRIADAKTLAALLYVERFHPHWLQPVQ